MCKVAASVVPKLLVQKMHVWFWSWHFSAGSRYYPIDTSVLLLLKETWDGILDPDRPDELTENQEDVDHLVGAPENVLLVGALEKIHVTVPNTKDRRRTDSIPRHHGIAVTLIGIPKQSEYGLNFPHLTMSHIGFVLSFYLCMRQSRIFHCWVQVCRHLPLIWTCFLFPGLLSVT